MNEKSGVHWACAKCGKESSEGETLDHATKLARAEGFVFRAAPRGEIRAICEDCASVKQLNTTDMAHYKKHNIGKI